MKKSTFTRLSVAAVLVLGVTLSACSQEQPPAAQSVQPPAVPATATTAPVNESVAPPVTAPIGAVVPTYSPEALETLLAPVALYPDPVLAQVLASSTNPQEVLDAGNWLVANPNAKGKELDTAATALGLTPPMIALMHFPTVVDMMCMKMDWTTELGSAFQADQPGVLAAVQRLRKQAAEMGNLKTSDQMKVTTEEQNNQPVIVVQPADPEVVYVPQYNPTAVYTTPAPTATTTTETTTVATDTGYSGGEMITAGLLSFGAGMLVNEVFNDDDDDDYYHPNYGYGYGGSPYYPPPYQPRYGNGYRPANGYNRPANYQRGFNNNNIYVNADGKDYFNKFEGGRNNYRKNADSPISAARPNRPELGELNQRAQSGQRPTLGQGDDRKVQGNYTGAKPGARPNTPAQRPSASNKVPTGAYAGAKPGARSDAGAQRPALTSKAPKGTYAGAADSAARQKLNPQTAGARDRGRTSTGNVAKPTARPQNVSKPTARKKPASSSSAFQGSRNKGNAERAASNRGRASMPKGSKPSAQRNSGQRQGNRSGQNRGSRR